jgi:hypothetical protein
MTFLKAIVTKKVKKTFKINEKVFINGVIRQILSDVPEAGIATICITLLGFEPPEDYALSLVIVS